MNVNFYALTHHIRIHAYGPLWLRKIWTLPFGATDGGLGLGVLQGSVKRVYPSLDIALGERNIALDKRKSDRVRHRNAPVDLAHESLQGRWPDLKSARNQLLH
jgi:hypothetical protein